MAGLSLRIVVGEIREHANAAHPLGLRARRERPRSRAAKQPDELAPFDHLVGAGEQRRRNVKADRVGRLQVDDELESGRQLDRHFGWFLAPEDAADVDACLAILVRKVRSVAHQPTSFGKLAPMV